MSYTLTLNCGCTVFVREDPDGGTPPVRTLQGRGDDCRLARHAVGVRVWLWDLLPDPATVSPRAQASAS
jgi:hypothetical protein